MNIDEINILSVLYILKAIHVIGFISWLAGLFYLGRLFVYSREAELEKEPDRSVLLRQFPTMQWRAYKIICNPAMMITWLAGLSMLALGIFSDRLPNYLSIENGTPGWMHLKLFLLVLLLAYHIWCKRIIKQLEEGTATFDAFQFRLFNEVPTLLLVLIVFTATLGLRYQLNYIYLLIGVTLFGILIYRAAVAYRKRREAKG